MHLPLQQDLHMTAPLWLDGFQVCPVATQGVVAKTSPAGEKLQQGQ